MRPETADVAPSTRLKARLASWWQQLRGAPDGSQPEGHDHSPSSIQGARLRIAVAAFSGTALVLLDLVRLRVSNGYAAEQAFDSLYVWGSLPACLILGLIALIPRSPLRAGITLGLLLWGWALTKGLILGNPSIIPTAYGLLSGVIGGVLVWLNGFTFLHSALLTADAPTSKPDRIQGLTVVRSEAQFYIERLLFSLAAIATVVGVTMTIVFTGIFFTGDAPVDEGDRRTALALGMLSSTAFIVIEVAVFGGIPLIQTYWDSRERLLAAFRMRESRIASPTAHYLPSRRRSNWPDR